MIPAYPFLILYAGGVIEWRPHTNKKILGGILALLCGWYLFSAVRAYPDYLGYFNELIGGSDNGYKYLDDSNLDWGQDLKRLKKYQNQHPELKVIYSWRRSNPGYYGIENDLLASGLSKKWLRNPLGLIAINTHFLIRNKLESIATQDPEINWLDNYVPIDRIGQSFFIYQF